MSALCQAETAQRLEAENELAVLRDTVAQRQSGQVVPIGAAVSPRADAAALTAPEALTTDEALREALEATLRRETSAKASLRAKDQEIAQAKLAIAQVRAAGSFSADWPLSLG